MLHQGTLKANEIDFIIEKKKIQSTTSFEECNYYYLLLTKRCAMGKNISSSLFPL